MAFILDTDHLVILQQRNQPAFKNLTARLGQTNPDDIFASIISFHEQMQGWLAFLNRSRSPSQIVMAYTELDEIGRSFFEMNVLPFSDEAQDRFGQLRKERVRIGTMDLRIASIALVEGATVLTANSRDFEEVPGLRIEDWTK
jgi:tRNA(fMet)-specific endonuclease VapC